MITVLDVIKNNIAYASNMNFIICVPLCRPIANRASISV